MLNYLEKYLVSIRNIDIYKNSSIKNRTNVNITESIMAVRVKEKVSTILKFQNSP